MSTRPAGKDMRGKDRRVIDRRVEERGYVGRFAAQLLVVAAAGGMLLYLAFYVLFAQPLPGTYAGVFFALRNLSAFLFPFIVLSILAYVLVVSVVIAVVSGYAFHKIAGPLYRMERALENFDSGEPVKAVFLRKTDQLVPLAHAYNRFVARLRDDRGKWLGAMEHAERFCLQDPATCRSEMQDALSRLSEMLSRYR